MTDPVRAAAGAKINLFFRALAREDSGFHQIETLLCRISLADELVIERTSSSGVALSSSGYPCGQPSDNLAVRAAQLVLDATGAPFGVRIALDKRVPPGSGLGGGSSDAAETLLAVNALANNAVPRHELLQLAARLGADVPFFVTGARCALAWGRGDRMLRLDPLPPQPGLLMLPKAPVSTATAYGWLAQARQTESRRGALLLETGSLTRWSDVARMSGNDFERAVFAHRTDIRASFEAAAGTRPMLCRLAGSGGAVAAVYRTERDRDAAVSQLGSKHGVVVPIVAG